MPCHVWCLRRRPARSGQAASCRQSCHGTTPQTLCDNCFLPNDNSFLRQEKPPSWAASRQKRFAFLIIFDLKIGKNKSKESFRVFLTNGLFCKDNNGNLVQFDLSINIGSKANLSILNVLIVLRFYRFFNLIIKSYWIVPISLYLGVSPRWSAGPACSGLAVRSVPMRDWPAATLHMPNAKQDVIINRIPNWNSAHNFHIMQ